MLSPVNISMINFCFDTVLDSTRNIIWPNCVDNQLASLENLVEQRGTWSNLPPFVDYPRILDYLRDEKISYQCFDIDSAPANSLYPINLNWFDHSIDYFELMSKPALNRVQQGLIKILFLYSEGDNPLLIQQRIFELCTQHQLNPINVHFVSANSFADQIANFHYFDDDNVIYYRSQLNQTPLSWHDATRSKKMTLLSRMHKSWRANFCSRFWANDFHQHSYFSYKVYELQEDISPLRPELQSASLAAFLDQCPFEADNFADHQHNFYGTRVDAHFNDAYWNCVLETHLAFENNIPGVFVSEKIWKPIAQAQPFIILGCAGTLAHLRNQGYQTFGRWIDESYDTITDTSMRFATVWNLVHQLNHLSFEDLHQLHLEMKTVVEHNQQLYWSGKANVLEDLFRDVRL
jgi:hypothetical protein